MWGGGGGGGWPSVLCVGLVAPRSLVQGTPLTDEITSSFPHPIPPAVCDGYLLCILLEECLPLKQRAERAKSQKAQKVNHAFLPRGHSDRRPNPRPPAMPSESARPAH